MDKQTLHKLDINIGGPVVDCTGHKKKKTNQEKVTEVLLKWLYFRS